MVAVIALTIVFVYLIAGIFSKYIYKILAIFSKMCAGDLTQKLNVKSSDEFGVLASDVNKLLRVWNNILYDLLELSANTKMASPINQIF